MIFLLKLILIMMLIILCILSGIVLYQVSLTLISFRKLAEELKNNCSDITNDVRYLKMRIDKVLDVTTNNCLLTADIMYVVSKIIDLTKILCANRNLTWFGILFMNLKFIKRLISDNKKR